MDDLISGDKHSVHRKLARLDSVSDLGESDLLHLLDLVPRLFERFPGESTVESGDEVIVWHDYESLIWQLGERIRQILKGRRLLRRSAELWAGVEAICLDTRLGKGRESFAMLLGQYGGRDRVPVLLQLLDDPDVAGHALYALRLLGAPEGEELARRFLESPKAWIRSEAEKYLVKIGAA